MEQLKKREIRKGKISMGMITSRFSFTKFLFIFTIIFNFY